MQEETNGVQGLSGAPSDGALTELKAAGKEAAATAKDAIQGLREQVTEKASSTVTDRKHVLADSMESVVHALRAAEKSLREDNQEALATYSSSIASYVERSTEYVRNNDMNGLMTDLQRAGRENTGVFMGSSFAAGAALGRFLRSSTPEADETGSYGTVSGTGEVSDSSYGGYGASGSEELT